MQQFGAKRSAGSRTTRSHEDVSAAQTSLGRVGYKQIAQAQRVADGQNREIRKTLARYADMIEQQRQMLYRSRNDIMLSRRAPEVLQSHDAALYGRLRDRIGEQRLARMERFVALYETDQSWADYLAHVAYIREGIHLESISNRDPLQEFHRQIIDAFEQLPEQIERQIVQTFRRVETAGGRLDTETAGLQRPSSTWTYMINDQFFQTTKKLFFWKHYT